MVSNLGARPCSSIVQTPWGPLMVAGGERYREEESPGIKETGDRKRYRESETEKQGESGRQRETKRAADTGRQRERWGGRENAVDEDQHYAAALSLALCWVMLGP